MKFKLTLAIIASLATAPAVAADRQLLEQATPARGVYAGVFGGGGFSTATDVTQLGTAFFIEAQGGPLAVNAPGRTNSGGVGFVGGQVGYEWSHGPAVLPAFEIEGFYLRTGTRHATVDNPTDRLDERTFDNSFSIRNSVLLASMILSFPTLHPGLTPYIGGGIGAARVSVDGANSLQTNPAGARRQPLQLQPRLICLDLRGISQGRCSHRPWAQRLRVRRVSLCVRRLQRSDFRADRVSRPCSHQRLDGSLRRYVLPSGDRRHRAQFLA